MRNHNLFVLAAVATLQLLIGCETDQRASDISADNQAIKIVIGEMTDAYAARDWDTFAASFTDDGIWMPPGLEPLSGEDAWWSLAQQWWDSSTVLDIGVTTEELVVLGDWAIERHTEFQVLSIGDGTEPVSMYFKGVWIFQRQDDGSWKIARYIWNENIPHST